MGKLLRTLVLGVLTWLSCVVLGVTSVFAAAPAIAGTEPTTLVVPPTTVSNTSLHPGFNDIARSRYVEPFYPDFGDTCSESAENCIGINYPATFWPLLGNETTPALKADKWNVSVGHGVENLNDVLILELAQHDEPIAIYGYSQGARVVSISKQNLINTLPPSAADRLSISLTGNISRPNGGTWSRFTNWGTIPILDITFGDPTPTDTGVPTTDVCGQYDGVCDFPNYFVSGLAFNSLAILNAIIGFVYWPHPTYLGPVSPPGQLPLGYAPAELEQQMDILQHPENFSVTGDTTYITIPLAPDAHLPIVKLALQLTAPFLKPIIEPLVELTEPLLRWRIDQAFNSNIDPGTPTPIRLFRIPFLDYDPFEEAAAFVAALEKGIADATDGVPIEAKIAPLTESAADSDASTDNGAVIVAEPTTPTSAEDTGLEATAVAESATEQDQTTATMPETGEAATMASEPPVNNDESETVPDVDAEVAELEALTSADDNASADQAATGSTDGASKLSEATTDAPTTSGADTSSTDTDSSAAPRGTDSASDAESAA